jgi:hypothetical protein
MSYSIYDPHTGEIIGYVAGSIDPYLQVTTLNPVAVTYVEGKYNANEYYVDINTQQVNPKAPRPVSGAYAYKFLNNNQWTVDLEQTEKIARQMRDTALESLDKINPVWYSTLTAQQQTELQQYRQALLDIPQQTGFPESVTWPTKPEWL